jgi:flagellar biosynthesis/type III secretory pathway protein FliH
MSNYHSNEPYYFNIKPGLPVKSASKSKSHPDPSKSIFNDYQLNLINQMIQYHVDEAINQLNARLLQEKKEEFQKGVKAGIQQAQQQLQTQVNQTLNILNQLTANLSSQIDQIKEDQQQELLAFVITMARKVIDTEIETNPVIILNVLKNALNLLNEREEVRILVNPKDWLTVKENINKLNLQIDLPKQIEIVNTPEITPGGCRLEYKSGSIDADIDTQFEEIKRKLLKNAE